MTYPLEATARSRIKKPTLTLLVGKVMREWISFAQPCQNVFAQPCQNVFAQPCQNVFAQPCQNVGSKRGAGQRGAGAAATGIVFSKSPSKVPGKLAPGQLRPRNQLSTFLGADSWAPGPNSFFVNQCQLPM